MTYPYPRRTGMPTWGKVALILTALLVALVGCTAALVSSAPPVPSASYVAPAPITPSPSTARAAAPIAPTPPTINVEVSEWGQGTWLVGEDIQPGRYKTNGDTESLFQFCMATREDKNGDPIGFPETTNAGPAYVTVKASDTALSLSGDCKWSRS